MPSYRRVTDINADTIKECTIEAGVGLIGQDWCAPEFVRHQDGISNNDNGRS